MKSQVDCRLTTLPKILFSIRIWLGLSPLVVAAAVTKLVAAAAVLAVAVAGVLSAAVAALLAAVV